MNLIFLFFIFSSLILLQSYLFYPVFIFFVFMARSKKKKCINEISSKISVVISAYNEEKVIEKTIRNLLDSNYDNSMVEIVIGSDNSTDNTNQIIEKLVGEFSNVKFITFEKRRGKSNVLNDLVKETKNDILVFADANTIYHKDALKNLVKYFANDEIGGVSGRLKLIDLEESTSSGSKEKFYWDLETWLKKWEGKLGILIGANGGIYAIRKELYVEIPTSHPVMDDFYISLKVLEQHKKFVFAENAVAEEFVAPSVDVEFYRKARNNAINLSTLKPLKKLLSPSYGLISFGLWSHKIIRWFTPVLLILLYISNIFLIGEASFFKIFFLLQNIFYLSALLGYLLKKIKIIVSPLLLCSYFVMTNIAMLVGIYRFIFNKQTAFWQSTARN